MAGEISEKEQRIRKVTHLYYSNPKIQKAILNFSKNRETIPRYFEGFGKRPDTLEYPGDVFGLVQKGATSFHVSEELWHDPLRISTSLTPQQFNELREGWDLLLDIDSKYIDYSKILVELIIKLFKFHGAKNFGIKFSGSKGFHIIIPWKAFPKEINEVQTKDMFPEWPRILTKYIMYATEKDLIEKVTQISKFGANKYVRDFQAPKEVMPDLILVSPRHLFRAPYSLHEKTSLASVVLKPEELENFELKDARPLKMEIRNFMPEVEEGEASELLREALDWHKTLPQEERGETKNFKNFKKVDLKELIGEKKISDRFFPPSIKKILLGINDGKKRALFILLNFFRSIGIDRKELEERLYSWNKKNPLPLPEGYLQSQLSWSYRNKSVLPPNFDKDYYKGIGVIPTFEEMRYKNPSNFAIKKLVQENEREEYLEKKAKKKSKKKVSVRKKEEEKKKIKKSKN